MSDFSGIETLAIGGQKIQAIKELRAMTGVGLKEAKDAVEWFQAHRQWPAQYRRDADSGSRPTQDDRLQTVGQPTGRRAELEQHVAQRQKINAIKLLREITQWGLRESKDAVEHYEAHGAWQPEVLAALGEPSVAPASVATRQSPPEPSLAGHAPRDPRLASVLEALARHLGYAPDVRLTVRARRLAHDGWLVMLRDRSCFVRQERGQWLVDPVIAYDMVSHVEAPASVRTVLYVSVGHVHERFELDAADADAALALFRVFAP